MRKYKINLHITEKCNFSCRYCFAKFDKMDDLGFDGWRKVIDKAKASGLVDAINFAGGEPVLHKDFVALVKYAYSQGFKLSLISNGSLLTNPKLMPKELFKCFSTIGISVDSFENEVLRSLGCCDHRQNVLSEDKVTALVNLIRSVNPSIKLKVNTVVNRLNVGENLVEKATALKIDRWKLLRMKPFESNGFSNFDLKISDEEFQAFVKRNEGLSRDTVVEPDLSRSYIIFNNKGDLLDNQADNYVVVGNAVQEDFTELMLKYNLDMAAYWSRYQDVAA